MVENSDDAINPSGKRGHSGLPSDDDSDIGEPPNRAKRTRISTSKDYSTLPYTATEASSIPQRIKEFVKQIAVIERRMEETRQELSGHETEINDIECEIEKLQKRQEKLNELKIEGLGRMKTDETALENLQRKKLALEAALTIMRESSAFC